MRDRLIRLIAEANQKSIEAKPWTPRQAIEIIADHLLANGVIVPPCKVGDTVYRLVACPLRVSQFTWEIVEIKIFADEINFVDDSDNVFVADEIGKTVFLTKEEAERALAERSGE
jgi:hypothetical protein